MPRIDEMPEYRARLSRTTHDLSHKFGFTASVAHLLPVFHDFLQAGETVELGFSYNLRTQPLASAAMVDIKSHVEYFFVPMFLLYEPFGSMFYNLNDNYSSLYPNGRTPDTSMVQKTLPVLDFSDLHDQVMSYGSNQVGYEQWFNHIYRLFDMLGYNNTDIDKPVTSPQTNWNPNVFPYPILAYNCIYQYYYRLDNREMFQQAKFNWDAFYNTQVVDYGVQANMLVEPWNWIRLFYRPKDSDYFTDVKVSPIVDVLNLNAVDSLPLAESWLSRADYYTGRPVVDAGKVGLLGTDDASIYANSPNLHGLNPGSDIVSNFGFSGDNININGASIVNGVDINTANIRALFANEKLNSITGRARKHYDDQVLAHLGYKVPHDVKHQISCFGHDRGVIHIGEVISTADTANAGLGDIAGKGYGSLQVKPHKFTAPCHGVVMAILSFVPDVCYADTYLKANAVTDRNSFYNPEYDSLGMQPLFGYEGSISDKSGANNIIGWQYRYEQWKRRFNRVTKAFSGNGSLDSWMLDFQAPKAVNAADTANYIEYVHSPSELNQVMLVNYVDTEDFDEDSTKMYDGDPFVIDGFVHCKKVSTMSDYSLPRLDA